MGVKNLWDILESCKKTLPLHHLQNKRVCIDLSCWIVQLQNVCKSNTSTKDRIYLRSLFHRLRALIALNCSLIFVTDGSIPAVKLYTYRKRLNLRSEVVQDEVMLNENKASSLKRNKGSEFSCMIREAKILGMALGIPCLDSVEEAEAQCALLNSEGLCDGCFSSDSDAFLFGAKTIYRDICLGDGGYVVCYDMKDIERELGYGRNSLVALALLLGGDYSHGVYGLGPESACRIVKSVGDDVVLKRIVSEGLSFARRSKGSRKQGQASKCTDKENHSEPEINDGSGHTYGRNNEFLQVADAYLNPKCHSANSDTVHRALVLHPLQRTKLQQVCSKFFEWPPNITDEYILPKIAERDLRRFANLRSTSSDLGVQLPYDRMPVQCPVSEIIKLRKVQGKGCFEVSWVGFDGLQSVVPADLLNSACPEKIVQFEEKKAEGKKKNHRKPKPKKQESQASMDEIHNKLQDLLIEIDVESRASNSYAHGLSDNRTSESRLHLESQEPVLVTEPFLVAEPMRDAGSNERKNASTSLRAENMIIDLLSPSPPARARRICKGQEHLNAIDKNVPKCQPVDSPHVDLIDLCDSETDASPEHRRKARELRLFLDSIRNDVH